LLQPHSANWVCTAAGMTQVPVTVFLVGTEGTESNDS